MEMDHLDIQSSINVFSYYFLVFQTILFRKTFHALNNQDTKYPALNSIQVLK